MVKHKLNRDEPRQLFDPVEAESQRKKREEINKKIFSFLRFSVWVILIVQTALVFTRTGSIQAEELNMTLDVALFIAMLKYFIIPWMVLCVIAMLGALCDSLDRLAR